MKPGSPVYDEAMLALGWSFLKVNKPDEAIKYAQWIIKNMPDSFLLSEAYLVEGYCYYMKKDFDNAEKSLSNAEKLTEQPVVSMAARDSARKAYEDNEAHFDSVQDKALDLSRQLPTPRVQMKRDQLRPDFDKANEAIDDYAKFMQRSQQSDRFESNRKRVLEDAGFTLATVKTKKAESGGGAGGANAQELQQLEDLEDLE